MSVELGIAHQEFYPTPPRPQRITPYEGVPPTDIPVQDYHVETRLIGKKNGRDIRATVMVNPDGTSVFDRQPPDVELYDTMYQKIEPGTHMLPGYEYPATVLPSERGIFYASQDAIGNKVALAEVFLLGDHYRNGVGEKIPGERAWSNYIKGYDSEGKPIYEDETRAFVSLSTSVHEPGRVKGHIMHWSDMNGEHQAARQVYDKVTQDEVHMQRMKNIREQVEQLRQEKIAKLLETPLSAVGD